MTITRSISPVLIMPSIFLNAAPLERNVGDTVIHEASAVLISFGSCVLAQKHLLVLNAAIAALVIAQMLRFCSATNNTIAVTQAKKPNSRVTTIGRSLSQTHGMHNLNCNGNYIDG